MILGIGSDITDIRRVAEVLARHGERFEKRCFTDLERARAHRKGDAPATFAKRFAAKEACAKALGTGMRLGVFWRDMGVINDPSGRPTLHLTGGALNRLRELTPMGWAPDIHVSLSDEYPYAQAYVILAARQQIAGTEPA